MLNLFRSLAPLDVLVLMMLFTSGSSLMREACERRGAVTRGPPCRVARSILGAFDTADVQFAAGATLLVYVMVGAHDRLAPRSLF